MDERKALPSAAARTAARDGGGKYAASPAAAHASSPALGAAAARVYRRKLNLRATLETRLSTLQFQPVLKSENQALSSVNTGYKWCQAAPASCTAVPRLCAACCARRWPPRGAARARCRGPRRCRAARSTGQPPGSTRHGVPVSAQPVGLLKVYRCILTRTHSPSPHPPPGQGHSSPRWLTVMLAAPLRGTKEGQPVCSGSKPRLT